MDVFSKLGFEKLTETVLSKRGSSGKAFSHGSIFGSLFFSYLCGGDCLEDINALTEQFRQRPGTLLPGADTVGRGLKELAEKNIVYKSETSDKSYSFNTAEKLKNFYLYLVRHISEKVKPLKKTSRLKAFILHFVSVPAKWVRTRRQNVLNLYTNKTYYSEVFLE